MKFLIIQEAGKHKENFAFRESLSLQKSLIKLGHEVVVWGDGYADFKTGFEIYEEWADIILILENYTPHWLPADKIAASKKLKIYWSIDSHLMLQEHVKLCQTYKIDILLNSSEQYIKYFTPFIKHCFWFPNAYPDDLVYPMDVEKKYDIGFCGNVDENRYLWLKNLIEFKPMTHVFVLGENMVKAVNSYKIHINLNVADDINIRTFETLGCKTFLLTNYTPNLKKLFDIDKDLVIYKSMGEMKDKIKYYLDNEKERNEIAEHGYNTVKKKHTYDCRARYLLRILSGTNNL